MTPRKLGIKAVLAESATVALVGGSVAFTLNALSPRGLDLTRDYFPGSVRIALTRTNAAGTNAPSLSQSELTAARLKAKGLQVLDHDQTRQLFEDFRYQTEQIVFVDARNDGHYQAGHIPRAYQFDHYRAPDYLAGVLPASLLAEKVVVYCEGGDCEDAEFAAVMLREASVPNERLFVYTGGFTEWSAHGMPVEIGARLSGNLRTTTK